MIRIEIEADTAQQAREQMRELLGMDRETGETEAPKPATRSRSTKAKDEGASAQTPAAGSEGAAASPTATGEVTRATVEPKCLTYSTKAGPAALKELFTEVGSPTGKWSGVTDEMLPALNTRLDDLLAG